MTRKVVQNTRPSFRAHAGRGMRLNFLPSRREKYGLGTSGKTASGFLDES